MTFNYYLAFNLAEFLATGLISRTQQVLLEGIGMKKISIVRGNEVSIVYEDVMLPVQFLGDNPFIWEGDDAHYAVAKDVDGNVWLGIEAT